jgi:hypothetical protein
MPERLDYFVPGDARLKRVFRAGNAMEAEFVRGVLEAEGIPAVVQGAALEATLAPILGGTTLPGVYVREQDLEDARDIVDRLESGEITAGTPWTCPNCGEAIEGQFSECWKCGTERPQDPAAAPDGDEPEDPR